MGFVIDISNNLVTIDHTHNDFCITTPHENPAVLFLGNLKVTSIFSRTKGERDTENCDVIFLIVRCLF